jgi:hypothetical protein
MVEIENTTLSKGVRRVFGLDLHSWEQLMLWSLGAAALAAVLVVVTTTSVIHLQRVEAADAMREFDLYKLGVEAKVADAKKEGIKAGETAGNAVLRAAELEKEAANARLLTEQIKAVVAWRTLTPQMASHLEKVLLAKPGAVNLRWMDGDPEALFLAIQISQILRKAKWQIAPGALKPANVIIFEISLPDSNSSDAGTLREAFTAAAIPFSTAPIPVAGAGFNISTIPGAPMLMVGSRPPPEFP